MILVTIVFLGNCSEVYLDGTSVPGTERSDITVWYNGATVGVNSLRVWAPTSDVIITLSDSNLQAVRNWASGVSCSAQEYQRSRITATTSISAGNTSQAFDVDVTSLVQV